MAPAQQFGINLRQFLQPLPVGLIMAHALLGTLLLGLVLEEEFQDMTGGQIGSQLIKGSVPLALRTGAMGFATGREPLHVGGAEQVWGNHKLAQESSLALA